ncbi:MAG: DUF5908 family protein [Desulfopila sp.]
MPIEIKELHIRVTVEGSGQNPDGRAGGREEDPGPAGGEKRDELVAECVEQVLEILRNRTER